jgi:hypothetical protein
MTTRQKYVRACKRRRQAFRRYVVANTRWDYVNLAGLSIRTMRKILRWDP